MVMFVVTLGRPGSGAGTFTALVPALTPGMARSTAMMQFPGMSVHAVKGSR